MGITGAALFIKALKQEKVKILFGYPGGQAIDLFDALYGQTEIEVVIPRHEQGLIHAADGYARSTGKVGVCLVTSGPGATNLVTGIATAHIDSVPLVCFAGQVATNLIGTDAFQEADMVGLSQCICKYAVSVRNREDLGKIIKKAFYIAKNGRPGVVVVDLPKDIQRSFGDDTYPEQFELNGHRRYDSVQMGPMKKAVRVLEQAARPLFLIGGGVRIADAGNELRQLVELTGVPVTTTIMGRGMLPTNHPLYIGNVGIHASYAANAAISQCDVLFSIGTRFNDRITGRTECFADHKTLIHIDIDPTSISKNVTADIPILADAKYAIEWLLKLAKPLQCREWLNRITKWKAAYPLKMNYSGLTPQCIIEKINQTFSNSVIVTDVGQNQLWATQFLELDENRQMLTSGGFGTMGYGFPAALGAKLGNPGKDVIVISGDGGMQMNIQEMATAVVQELPVIICIFNNGYLGNVRQWQELFYQKRYVGTCLRYRKSCAVDCSSPGKGCPAYTPDFMKLAESYGACGIRVTEPGEIDAAFRAAKNNSKIPTVIEFIIEPEENVLPIVPPGSPLMEMILGQ